MTLANRLDRDHTRQNLGPDLDPTVWHSDGIPLKRFSKKLILKKSADDKKKHEISQGAKN